MEGRALVQPKNPNENNGLQVGLCARPKVWQFSLPTGAVRPGAADPKQTDAISTVDNYGAILDVKPTPQAKPWAEMPTVLPTGVRDRSSNDVAQLLEWRKTEEDPASLR